MDIFIQFIKTRDGAFYYANLLYTKTGRKIFLVKILVILTLKDTEDSSIRIT